VLGCPVLTKTRESGPARRKEEGEETDHRELGGRRGGKTAPSRNPNKLIARILERDRIATRRFILTIRPLNFSLV
jgi:hypothetical protein